MIDGPQASSFGKPADTTYINLNSAVTSTPLIETVLPSSDSGENPGPNPDDAYPGPNQIEHPGSDLAEHPGPDYHLKLDDPPHFDFTSPLLGDDFGCDGVFSYPTFDFSDGEHAFTAYNAYHFDPPLPDNSDGPYSFDDDLINTKYNTFGGSKWQEVLMDRVVNQAVLDEYKQYAVSNLEMQEVLYQAGYPKTMTPAQRDYSFLRRFFGGLNVDKIKKTFEITFQNRMRPPATRLERSFKTNYPLSNCQNCDEHNYMDMIVSSYPAILGGEQQRMFFSGDQSNHCSTYKMKGQGGKYYVAATQDRIREVGRPRGFRGDCHPMYYGQEWIGFLRDMVLSWWNSEPYMQHQQKGERRWRTIQSMASRTMSRVGAPHNWWFLALSLACIIWNCSAIQLPSDTWSTPHALFGDGIPDISSLLCFELYQEVYYVPEGGAAKLPEVKERCGRWASIADSVGHDMTWKIIDDVTGPFHFCLLVRPVNDLYTPNCRADTISGADIKVDYPALISPMPVPDST